MSENIQAVTDETFEQEVLNSDKLVLVDFWATWCAPCRVLAPIIEEVAVDFAEQVKVVNVDVDENSETAGKYNIKGIPTLLLFKGGEVKADSVGASSKDHIEKMIQAQLQETA
ncbi:thioredoxin [Acidobacteria bacterium AH-259-D05]|nr:thioredoxin [Acidobacteria bacterium AH-259-D05]